MPRILGTTGHRRSELFARDDGFYVGAYTSDYSAAFHSLDETGAYLRFLAKNSLRPMHDPRIDESVIFQNA